MPGGIFTLLQGGSQSWVGLPSAPAGRPGLATPPGGGLPTEARGLRLGTGLLRTCESRTRAVFMGPSLQGTNS